MDNKEGIYNCRSNERMFSIDSECVFPLDNSLQCTGYFNYMNVELKSINEIALLYHMGFFGKGSFSRSKPECLNNDGHQKIMRKRQFSKRMSMFKRFNCPRSCSESKLFLEDVLKLTRSIAQSADKATNKNVIDLVSSDEDNNSEESINGIDQNDAVYDVDKHDIVVVVPNSDSEGENYFEKFCPKSCVCKIKINEKLALSLQEAFFLSYGLGCLQIVDENNTILDVNQCWELFNKTDKNFIPKYVVYHFYRSKDYIVKPGIKFGSDYLLYKDGPGLSHAAYIVLIEHQGQNMPEWSSILGHLRIAATTVKDILLAEVVRNDTEVLDGPKELENYSVRESLITRKLPITVKDDN